MATATVCHVPRWSAGGWACTRCGARLRGSAADVGAATARTCPASFGGAFHCSHSLSVGVAREGVWQEGVPIAMCRVCGYYASHKCTGLSRPCKHRDDGRKVRKRRFLVDGRHPEPGSKLRIECVRHFAAGGFLGRGAALPPEEGLADAAALVAPPPAEHCQPPEDAAGAADDAERVLLEAFPEPAMQVEEEEEDCFDFENDLGEAAYRQDAAEDGQGHAASDRTQPPQAKRARTEATGHAGFVAASLEGLEARLTACGEVPRFVPMQPGLLRHECRTVNASVSFWTGSLKWCVDGPQAAVIDAGLIAPFVDASPSTPSMSFLSMSV